MQSIGPSKPECLLELHILIHKKLCYPTEFTSSHKLPETHSAEQGV